MLPAHLDHISRTSSHLQHLIWQLLPPACRKCNTLLSGKELKSIAAPFLCDLCLQSLPWTDQEHSCQQCANPTAETHRLRCPHCLEQDWFFNQIHSAFCYDADIRDWVHHLKFGSKEQLAPLLGRLCALSFQGKHSFLEADAVIPIPLHVNRLRRRGFNQSLLIAHYFSKNLESNLCLRPQWLTRVRATPPQAQLSFHDRLHNLDSAFEASKQVQGKKILLLDDVMTTGTTLNAASLALKEAGASSVSVCVLARRHRDTGNTGFD